MTEFEVYRGTCDASAAAGAGEGPLFIAASDEDYILRVYDSAAPGKPLSTFDLISHLKPENPKKEPDIEGAARIGSRIYWITSHGADKNAVHQESRHRFFATDVALTGGTVKITPFGTPYRKLLQDLSSAPDLAGFKLGEAGKLKPEGDGGLNIEGLAPGLDGSLLIAFRNPIPNRRALIVRLRNPSRVLENPGASAEVSLAAHLDLDGRGVRALDLLADRNEYLMIGGAHNDDRRFQLFRWSGDAQSKPVPIPNALPEALNPEELLVTRLAQGTIVVRVLSDDGDVIVGGQKCKDLNDTPEKQSFRAGKLGQT